MRLKDCEIACREATSFESWLKSATEYDRLHRHDEWRSQNESPLYPFELLIEQIRDVRKLRNSHQTEALIAYLQEGLYRTLGEIRPFIETEEWADGVVSMDIPMMRIGRQHNANHFIVSQTNPHVLPFVRAGEKSGLGPYFLELVHASLQAQIHQIIAVTKKRVKNRNLRFWMDRTAALVGQEYLGDINLHPAIPLKDYIKIMSNPTTDEIHQFIVAGERATWEKMAMIRNHTRISRTFERCYERLKRKK